MTGFQSKRAMAQDRFDVVDLGMYTDEGNRIAEMLCDSAVLFGWTWPVLYAKTTERIIYTLTQQRS